MSSKEAAAGAEVAVAEPEQQQKAKPRKKPPRQQPRYHVILWNDDDHTYEYVIEMMQKLFGHPQEKGFLIAKEVDKQGKAICLTTTMEHAELKRALAARYRSFKSRRGYFISCSPKAGDRAVQVCAVRWKATFMSSTPPGARRRRLRRSRIHFR